MEYILISMVTISLFTYLIYVLVNKLLAIKIHIKFLALCACCALFISLILPRMLVSFTGLTGTLGIVAVFAIISSFFITYYYDNSVQNQEIEESLTADVPEAIEFPEQLQIQLTTNTDDTIDDEAYPFSFNQKEVILINYLETVLDKTIEIATSEDVLIDTVDENIDHEIILLSVSENVIEQTNLELGLDHMIEIVDDTEEVTDFVTKQYLYPLVYQEAKLPCKYLAINDFIPQMQPEIIIAGPIKINEEIEVVNNLMKFKKQAHILDTPLFSNALTEHLNLSGSNETMLEPQQHDQDLSEQLIEDSQPASTTLDDLMDFAFLQKEQRNFLQALKTFRQTLLLYPTSEAAPYLVMEIGAILKNIGSYNEAITAFTEGRLLPGVINNSMLEQEFVNNIAYLRVVKNILIKNSLQFMPFNRIPEDVFQEINAEFREWRNQS